LKRFMQALSVLWLLGQAAAASAHEGSTSYLLASAGPDKLAARFDVALLDVAWAVPLDGDSDGRLTWNEVWDGRSGIAAYLARTIRFSRGGEPCAADVGEPWLTHRLGFPYLSVDMALQCPGAGAVGIASDAFFDADASHRVLVSLESRGSDDVTTLSPENRVWSEPAARSGWETARDFMAQGIWHVWIGYDHLLFLLLLLLPAVATRAAGGKGRGRAIALDLVRVVTAFTVAHSITLALAATGTVRLPQQPIEAAIAMSIVIAACLNLAPSMARFRLPLAFGFGLVHGFGFANALAGLGAGGTQWRAMAGFNVGVEIANLALIAVLLPILLWAGRRRWYAPHALPALSLASAAVGAAWLIDRL
jgi:hypothetical protein